MNRVHIEDDDADGRALFEAVESAHGEYSVSISLYPMRGSDFDFSYTPLVVDDERGEAALVADRDHPGPECLKLSLASSGSALEAYAAEPQYGTTFLGNVMQVREAGHRKL